MSLKTKVSGVWKENLIHTKVSGAWKSVPQVYTKVSGAWKPLYSFKWETGDWGECSATCGGGTQPRSVRTLRSDGQYFGDSVGIKFAGNKPTISQACNTQSCTECKYSTGSSGTYYYKSYTESYCRNSLRGSRITSSRVVWNGTVIADSLGNYGGYSYYLNKTESSSCGGHYDITQDVCSIHATGYKRDCTSYSSICRTPL